MVIIPLSLVCPDRCRCQPSALIATPLVLCYSTVLCDARDQPPAPPVSRGEISARLLSPRRRATLAWPRRHGCRIAARSSYAFPPPCSPHP